MRTSLLVLIGPLTYTHREHVGVHEPLFWGTQLRLNKNGSAFCLFMIQIFKLVPVVMFLEAVRGSKSETFSPNMYLNEHA